MSELFTEFYTGIILNNELTYTEKANKLLASISEFDGDNLEHLKSMATYFLLLDEDFERVIVLCGQFLNETSHYQFHYEIYHNWISALEKTNRWDEAIALRMKMAEERGLRHIYGEIAEAYEEADDLDNALLYYDKSLAEEERGLEEDTLERIAEIYDEREDYKNSGRYFLAAAIETCRDYDYLWQNTGRAFALAGQEDEAFKYFQIALILNPKSENSLYSIGQVYHNKGDYFRALHYYTETLKINPNNPLVLNNLGALAFDEEGDIKGAIEKIETALENTDNPKLQLTFHLNLSRLYHKISDYDKHDYHKSFVLKAAGFEDLIEGWDDDGEEDEDEDDKLA